MTKIPQITASELVLSAIFFLQQKNGVTATEITKFICSKRKCKPGKVKGQVKKALDRATKNGIFSKKRGLYRIENGFGEKSVKGKKGRQANEDSKARAKKARTRAATKKIPVQRAGYDEGTSSFDNKIFKPGVSGRFPFHSLKVLENKIKMTASNEDRLSNSDNRADIVSLKGVRRGVAEDNEEYEDEDFLEDDGDDDEVDYFTDEELLGAADVLSTACFRRKSSVTDELSFSENESDDRPEKRKLNPTEMIRMSRKRKRVRTSVDGIDEGSESNAEDGTDVRETNANRTNETLYKIKFNEGNGNQAEDHNGTESNFSEDSDEGSRDSSEYKRSDASIECSDIENTSEETLKGNAHINDKDNNVSVKDRKDSAKESQKQEKVMQNKDEFNKEIQLGKQSGLQKSNVPENTNDSADPEQKKTNDSQKQVLSESETRIPQAPAAQEDAPSPDGRHSSSSRWEPKEKVLRTNRRRTATEKNASDPREQPKVKGKAGKRPPVRVLN